MSAERIQSHFRPNPQGAVFEIASDLVEPPLQLDELRDLDFSFRIMELHKRIDQLRDYDIRPGTINLFEEVVKHWFKSKFAQPDLYYQSFYKTFILKEAEFWEEKRPSLWRHQLVTTS